MPATSEHPLSHIDTPFDPNSPLEIERVTLLERLAALVDHGTLEIVQAAAQHIRQPKLWEVASSQHGSAHAQPE